MAHALRQPGQLQLLPRHAARGPAQALRGIVEPLVAQVDLALHAVVQALRQQLQRAQPEVARLRHQLRRGGGRGRAQVGAEIGDGEVRLVPHAAEHGHRALHDGARQLGVVEGPEILHGAAAAHQQDHVDRRHAGIVSLFGLQPLPSLRQQIQFR